MTWNPALVPVSTSTRYPSCSTFSHKVCRQDSLSTALGSSSKVLEQSTRSYWRLEELYMYKIFLVVWLGYLTCQVTGV